MTGICQSDKKGQMRVLMYEDVQPNSVLDIRKTGGSGLVSSFPQICYGVSSQSVRGETIKNIWPGIDYRIKKATSGIWCIEVYELKVLDMVFWPYMVIDLKSDVN